MMHIEVVPEGKEVHTLDKCIILFRDKKPSAILRIDEEKTPFYCSYEEEQKDDQLLLDWIARKTNEKTLKVILPADEFSSDSYLALGRALEEEATP